MLPNVGVAIWNKGVDVLFRGFALARQKRNAQGISGVTFVQVRLAAVGLLSVNVSFQDLDTRPTTAINSNSF